MVREIPTWEIEEFQIIFTSTTENYLHLDFRLYDVIFLNVLSRFNPVKLFIFVLTCISKVQ